MPLSVSVEPASVCQLRCPECPVGQRQAGIAGKEALMPDTVWQRTLSEVASTAWVIQFYFQGEPLLNPHLPAMVAQAHDAGLYTILSTNAQAMTPDMAQALIEAGLDRIIISMDGLSDASYNAYRVGGSLEKTKVAMRALREAKTKLHGHTTIELQCLRLRTNEHEWQQFKRLYKDLGADRLVFKTAQLYDYSDGHPLMPSNLRYSRYLPGKDGKYHRRKLHRLCWRVWSGAVITTAGEVLPCCYDKAHAHAYGNIMNAPMRTLYANDASRAFRHAALRQTPLICRECYK